MLEATVVVQRGAFALDVDLRVDDGEVVALLGPNGAGKTTVLRSIAGLVPLDAGRISVDGTVLDDPAAGVFVPPEQRRVGVVFQDHLLFPRMSVRDNVAFGLRAAGRPRGEARAEAEALLGRFGLEQLADARPGALSGGQAQRVALARALAIAPTVLLLDEPLAALDAEVRPDVRAELRRQLTAFDGARLLVTHDPVDALVLADRLVVVEDGRVVQEGTAADIVARPASRFVAELVGANLLHGEVVDPHRVALPSGAELTVADRLSSGRVALVVRPQAIALHRDEPGGSPRNTWHARIADVEADVDRVRVRLSGPVPVTAEVTPGAVADLGLVAGAEVWASVKAVDLRVHVE